MATSANPLIDLLTRVQAEREITQSRGCLRRCGRRWHGRFDVYSRIRVSIPPLVSDWTEEESND